MANIKYSVCFLYTLFLSKVQCSRNISKRSLFFPTTTVLQYTYGLSVPLTIEESGESTTILLSTCLQGNYDLPKKSTDLQVHDLVKRDIVEEPDTTKIEVYKYFVSYLRSLDIDGPGCLARMICEIAKYPLDVDKDDNVFEKILQYILTPSEADFDDMEDEDQTFYSELLMAEEDGRQKKNCLTFHQGKVHDPKWSRNLAQQQLKNDPNFYPKIIFSDEAHFWLNVPQQAKHALLVRQCSRKNYGLLLFMRY